MLKEIHGKRPRFNDRQRRRLAAKANKIRFGRLKEIAGIATPQTLRAWFRKLVAQKYDSYGEKKFMGRTFDGIYRKTFVLDKNKKIIKIYDKVKPAIHPQEVLDFIKENQD